MIIQDMNTIEYGVAWHYQQELFDKAIAQKTNSEPTQNHLLLCEHPHTITMGKHAHRQNVLFDEEYLRQRGVSLFQIDRGGDVTYHGTGQLVVYPIFDLEAYNIGLRQYIHTIEEVIIRTLASYQIESSRLDGAAGVWLDADIPGKTRKIAAIGVRSSRFVTMHGLALNVNTDLSYFSLINPCGFVDKGVTSMHLELGQNIDINEVKSRMVKQFTDLFRS